MARRAPLPYWPGLDGLRGLAVLAVLLFHGGVSWVQGGFLGVSLFFTISGFLITSLLLSEHRANGDIRLSSFWARRARRLLPASLVALVLATLTIGIVLPVADRSAAAIDVRAALANIANWRFIWADQPYLESGKVPSPVQHYWSLSIEEQFYLVFPLAAAMVLRWRVRGIAVLLGLVTLWSVARQVSIADPVRIYYGTDTRAAEVAVGGLLACLFAAGRRRPASDASRAVVGDGLGAVALLVTAALWWGVAQDDAFLYDGGLLAVALVSGVLVYGAIEGRRVAGWLAVAPLRELGKMSYGVYLFHFPLFLLLTEERIGISGPALLAVRLAATLAVAAASYRWLELPIRRGGALPGRQAVTALALGVAAVLLVTIPVRDRADDAVAASPAGTQGITVRPATDVPTAGEARVPRLVVVGDSTAGTFGEGLQSWGLESERAEVTVVSSVGCAPLLGERFRVRDGYEFEPEGCEDLLPTAVELAGATDADAIVVLLGSSQLADWRYDGEDDWRGIDEPEIAEAYRAALAEDLDTLAAAGLPILWADVPTPDWDVDAFGEQLGTPLPGSGRVTLNDRARAERLNDLDAEVVAAHPLAVVWSLRALVERPDGTVAPSLRPDGLHVAPEEVPGLAEAGLFTVLEQAYAEVLERRPPGLAAPAATAWTAPAVSRSG